MAQKQYLWIVLIAIVMAVSVQQGMLKLIYSLYLWKVNGKVYPKIFMNRNISQYFFYLAFGLECWSCDAIQNPNCVDPFDSSKMTSDQKVPCNPNQGGKESACLKVKISEFFLYKYISNVDLKA